MIEAKDLRTFFRIYSILKSARLRANTELTVHKALIRSEMTCAFPAWDSVADTCLSKLQRPQNKVFRTIKNFPKCTSVCDSHTAFNLPYLYDYVTKLAVILPLLSGLSLVTVTDHCPSTGIPGLSRFSIYFGI
jgi:hypothetical protein